MATARFSDADTGLSMATFLQKNGTANDLFVSLSVPEHYGWGAVGIGQQMAGANMFIVYPASDKTDVTLSIRTTPAEVMPHHVDTPACQARDAKVVDNMIQATAVCFGAGDLQNLALNPLSQSQWIYAVGPNIQVDSDSVSAVIQKHSTHGTFMLDLAAAQRAEASGAASSSPALPVATGGPSTAVAGPMQISDYNSLVLTHAALMGGSFVLLYPIAVLLLRLVSTRAHYIMTIFTTTIVFIGFVLGLVLSKYGLDYASFTEAHQIIGILVSSLLIIAQLPGGAVGHYIFKRTGKPSLLGFVHRYSGRVLVLLGSINGILGFLLDGPNETGAIAYGVIALFIWVVLIIFSEIWVRRTKSRRTAAVAEKPATASSQEDSHA